MKIDTGNQLSSIPSNERQMQYGPPNSNIELVQLGVNNEANTDEDQLEIDR